MKKTVLIIYFLSVLFGGQAQSYSFIQYQNSDENFANPERGFYHATTSLAFDNLRYYRDVEGISVIYWNFALDEFKSTEIASWYLAKMASDFEAMRKAGVKAVIRFSYTEKSTSPYGDAPIDIVQMHIKQVKPVLMANSDVILVVQAGFIGAWGEWWYTDYFATTPGTITEEQWDWRRSIVDSLLGAISPDRMVQLRTPLYKKNVMQQEELTPVSEEEAFGGSTISRIGHHNDCFVASISDWGTYQDTTVEKPYLAEDTKYTMMGGETCNVCEYSHCENTLKELRRFHWTYLNIDYHSGVIGDWKDEGCFPDIQTKLGYRYRLVSAEIQDQSKALDQFNLSLKILNDGWSNPLNPRDIEVVLINEENNKEYYVPVNNDPRLWPIDDTIHLSINSGIPGFIEDGNYSVHLNLPDPEGSLKMRIEYAIRLANTGTWDSVSGYNSLLHTLNINQNNVADTYIGGNYFQKKNQVVLNNIDIKIDGSSEDWESVPILYSDYTQNAKLLKVYNSSDTLFFLVEGNILQETSYFFIDADNNPETGYFASDWLENGADYLIHDNLMFSHEGASDEWGWTAIGTLDKVQNEQVLEMKAGLDWFNAVPLATEFHLAYVNDPQTPEEASYLPQKNSSFINYKQNNLFGPPPALQSTQYGNNVVLYWTRNQNYNVSTMVERSEDGLDYQPVFTANNTTISYTDKNLTVGQLYSYRVRYVEGYNFSERTGDESRLISNDEKMFARIKIDGEPVDWDLVSPAATGLVDETITGIRFFNTSDSLFFSIKTTSPTKLNSYRLFLNTNGKNTFNYKISNDSLFKLDGSSWLYQNKLAGFGNENFLESGLLLSEIEFENNNSLQASALVNGTDVWGDGEVFFFLKYGTISTPDNFKLKPSINDPYHTIRIQWTPNPGLEGFIIERSTNDSLHFEQIADLASSKNFYLDSGLDSANIYYYRMFSYIGINPSAYTITIRMKTAWVGIQEDVDALASKIHIFPNPASDNAAVHIQFKKPEKVEIELYNLNHKKVRDIFSGNISGKRSITFETSGLSNGIDLVSIKMQGIQIHKKLIIY